MTTQAPCARCGKMFEQNHPKHLHCNPWCQAEDGDFSGYRLNEANQLNIAIEIVAEYREQEIAARAVCVEARRSPSPYDFRIIAASHIKERLEKAKGDNLAPWDDLPSPEPQSPASAAPKGGEGQS